MIRFVPPVTLDVRNGDAEKLDRQSAAAHEYCRGMYMEPTFDERSRLVGYNPYKRLARLESDPYKALAQKHRKDMRTAEAMTHTIGISKNRDDVEEACG